MPNPSKIKNDKIFDKKSAMEDLESFIKKKKNQNRILEKLLYNLNLEQNKNKQK